ncbi:CheR family methyltransferase [Candidatus Epulonipiscium viviparus]|uniref:CheR family methyltransferase n=1 Tax=Candidatus Epulonipiscium viviparus TaxID=420336 RepID=UPI00016BFD8C|nr:protein-glutamate O-methyltransferase CheR [Candidatus Epulopiscium viviparus]
MDNLICDLEEQKEDVEEIIFKIYERKGTNFEDYKKSTIVRRIKKRMKMLELNHMHEYIDYINRFDDEIDTLHNEIFIGVTGFFRDPDAFASLYNALDQIYQEKELDETIRVWSAGCSTGEEAYSIAILIVEYLEEKNLPINIKIFATDINDIALSKAQNGIYTEDQLVDVNPVRLNKYFDKKGQNYQVKKYIRSLIIFAKHNIISEAPFSKLDLISCRNVLIYLENIIQQKVFAAFGFSLKENGYLFLGTSESLGEMGKYFEAVNFKQKIFRRLKITEAVPTSTYSTPFEHLISHKLAEKSVDRAIGKIIELLQQEYIPKGVIINESYELIHSFGDVNDFIKIPTNRISLNILKMIRKDLAVLIGAAVTNLFVSGRSFRYENITQSNKEDEINLLVSAYVDELSNNRYGILLFEENKKVTHILETKQFKAEDDAKDTINYLEEELRLTKENMQTLIEELRASNEELQSMNEELVLSNEELQHVNEELQSATEELCVIERNNHK